MASERSVLPASADPMLTPVEWLKGVGPPRAQLLRRMGLATVRDLLFLFPRDYQDLTDRRQIAQLEEGKLQTVRGVVEDIELRNTSVPGRSVLGVLVHCGPGYLRALWFNQPFQAERFAAGQEVMLSGKPKRNGLFWEMAHPTVVRLGEGEEEPPGGMLPVYPLTEGLNQWQMRRIVQGALEAYAEQVGEVFPLSYLSAHQLMPIREALPAIHAPRNAEELGRARRRFVYQELFILQLALALKRQQQAARQAPPLEATPRIDARIRRLFPFPLTAAQEQAIREIAADMARPVPMNRLLQGDVGSGKTVVAVYAMLLAIAHGYQAVLMAPTEILARQHSLTLERLLAASHVRRAQLTGGLSGKDRNTILIKLAAGSLDLLVGTHAVIQEDVLFARLGLAVIDEQHKFGVEQRAMLRQAGLDPHYLVMTATPIPRSVTMTLFGDLDLSTLRDSPPGRQPVHTYLATDAQRSKWWEFFARKLRQGRQGYVIAPLVEESAEREAASVQEVFESLANGPLEPFRLGMIHGRMTSEEKEAVMASFRSGQIQVLVSTAVVEVGVDVPNATLMTIENAEQFGLAQLHQLRGRVSRGHYPGFCCAFADPKSDEARQRLQAFQSTTDGFQLAEVDFRLRGPGELFGTRQHGLPPFRIADLVRDADVVEEARRDAQQLLAADPGLGQAECASLRRMMLVRYGKSLELGDVG
jgi:ATP-dependent DNA helicase RecG